MTDAPAVVKIEHVVPSALGRPTLSRMKIVGGGPAAVNVMSISPPPDGSVKLWKSLPFTSTDPLNVSVTSVGVGAVVEEFELLLQPASRISRATGIAPFMKRGIVSYRRQWNAVGRDFIRSEQTRGRRQHRGRFCC